MIPIRILGTGTALLGEAVTTAELVTRCETRFDAAEAVAATGIVRRHWAPSGTRPTELAVPALRQALDAAGVAPSELSRLIFVCSVGGDLLIPATANLVARALGVPAGCAAFDLNNACTGFLSAFELASCCLHAAGDAARPIAIVAVELLSPFIGPDDPRPYLVMGDAAAAAVVGPARANEGVVAAVLGNDPDHAGDIDMGHPTHDGVARLRFHASNQDIGRTVLRGVVGCVRACLERARLTPAEVDWVVPHQPNGPLLDALLDQLELDPERLVRVYQDIGSVGAASLPFSLDRLLRTQDVRPGAHLLMLAVGAGMSYGALVHRVGPA